MEDEYSDVHRYFLREIMNNGVLLESDATKLIDDIIDIDFELKDVIYAINEKINRFKQQIKIVNNETTGVKEVVFLSFSDDEISRSQTLYHKNDVEYLKYLLEAIILSDKKEISVFNAINIASKVQSSNLPLIRAQELLDDWVSLRYFKKSDTNIYSLDTRSIHDFESYFKNNFRNAIDTCNICKNLVFQTINCSSCDKHFHIYCLKSYVDKIQKWPCCRQRFDTECFNSTQSLQNLINMSQSESQSSSATPINRKRKEK